MFVRKKRHRSGAISVVVVDKSGGRFREIKNFGVVSTDEEVDILYQKARQWILHYGGQQSLDFYGSNKTEADIAYVLSNITHLFRELSSALSQ